MSQRRIEVGCFLADFPLGLRMAGVANLTHQVDAVGNHNEDDTHVLGKGQQQITEILRLDDGILLVKLLDAL